MDEENDCYEKGERKIDDDENSDSSSSSVGRRSSSSKKIKLMIAWTILGLASWVQTNGIFQELPQIAKKAPEGYDLFSYATILVALSNIFPMVYLYFLDRKRIESYERYTIYIAIGLGGSIVCVLLSLLYDHVTILKGNHESSVALFVLIFIAGGLDCTTSVRFHYSKTMFNFATKITYPFFYNR